MKTLSRYIFFVLCLFIPVVTFAQIPQELLDKAKAAGMTEEQIQQEMRKRLEQQHSNQPVISAAEHPVTDRITIDTEIPPTGVTTRKQYSAG